MTDDGSAQRKMPAAPRSMLARVALLKPFVRTVVTVRPEHAALAKTAGFDSFESVWRLESGKAAATHRDRHAVEIAVDSEGHREFFLKRLGRAHLKHVIEAAVALEWPVSKCRREWQFAQALARVGIRTAPLISFGERRLGFWPLESFLVVERLYDTESLDVLLAGLAHLPTEQRLTETCRLTTALARTIAAMHSAGFFHRDLYAKHVFCRRNGGEFAIYIIDLQRMRKDCGKRAITQDLAALNVTVAAAVASPRMRLRFLREYLRLSAENEGRKEGLRKGELRGFAETIRARSVRISGRSKFKNIQWLRRD